MASASSSPARLPSGAGRLHILDTHPAFDEERARGPQPRGTHYHSADTRDHDALAAAFKAAFTTGGRRCLDFVFANAGVVELSNLFAASEDPDEALPLLD